MSHQYFDPAREAKVERLRQLGRPRVVDLFSGCGGLSLGFHRAGFAILANVEFDAHAASTHARNFHADDPRHSVKRNIMTIEPEELLEQVGLHGDDPSAVVDVIIGGPPCQAYTRIGRAKLRKVHEHPEAYLGDERGNLYLRYLHFVEKLKPLAVVMENVPDALNYGGINIPEEVAETLSGWGYSCRYTLLNAIHYGVPQYRERMILIALAPELAAQPEFPTPTHWEELPEGYQQFRKALARRLHGNHVQLTFDQEEEGFLIPPPVPSQPGRLPPPVSAKVALSGLPPVEPGPAKGAEPKFYSDLQPSNHFDREMREWPHFEAGALIQNHFTRSQPRDYPIFRAMAPGDQYPEAYRTATELFHARLRELGETAPVEGTPEWAALKKEIVPPYDPTKFPNKWRKMEPDRPCRTLMAHLGKDTYSHIHYDSDQARTITVREAARLQTFPDGFWFPASMSAAYRMIGNAVPPRFSFEIARQLRKTLAEAVRQPDGT